MDSVNGVWRAGLAFLAINIHVKRRDKESEVQIQATLVRSPGPPEPAEVPQRVLGALAAFCAPVRASFS